MRALARIVCVFLLAGSASGCFSVNAQLPGTLRGDVGPDRVEALGNVEIEKNSWFFLWGLIGSPPEDFFREELARQVGAKGGDGIAGLVYESEQTCGDLCLGGITLGCIMPRTFRL